MKSGKSWSLNDVDDVTRRALLKAAEQSGLSVNEWLGNDEDDEVDPRPLEIDPGEDDEDAIGMDHDHHGDPGSFELSAAIIRLTDRLRGLDDKARASAGDLKSRLADIEQRLGHVADSNQTGAARERSLSRIAEDVDRLVRDLDNLDERARSTIEGLGTRTTQPSAASRGKAATDDGRQPDFDRAAPHEGSGEPHRLDDIRRRLDDLLAKSSNPINEPPPRAANIEVALRAMEARIDEAKASRRTERQPQPSAQSSSAADQIQRVEARLNAISGRLPPRKDADRAAAVRESSAYQHNIDDRAETAAQRKDQKALSEAVGALRSDIGSLTEQVAAMGRSGAEEQEAVRDLAYRIDALVAEWPLERAALDQIRTDMDAIKERIDGGQQSAIANIEARFAELAGHLDEIVRKVPDHFRIDALGEEVSALRQAVEADDDSANAIAQLQSRIDEMAQALAASVSALDAASPGDTHVVRLEQRLDDIADSLSGLVARAPSDVASPTVAGLENRLAEMTAAINGLIDRQPAGEANIDIGALERRLKEMAASITDRLAAGASGEGAPDIARLEGRLADIDDSIKGLYMGAPIGTSAGKLDERLDEIASGIEGLLQRGVPAADSGSLNDRLQALAERIDGLNIPQNDVQADLDDIKTDVASIRAVHQRLQTLTERIDGLIETQHQPLLAVAEIKEGIGAIRGMYSRIQTLTDRVDRMSAVQHDNVPAIDQMKTSIAAMRAVHERLEALGDRIDGLGVASEPVAALDEFRSGIAAIQATHEQLSSLAERIDTIAVERQPALAFDEIKNEIAGIRSEIAARAAPDTEQLKSQVRELAARIEAGPSAEAQAPAITALEAQVANITKALAAHKPQTTSILAIEERIERLQRHLAGTRKDSIDAARQEAREAVRELSGMVSGKGAASDLVGAAMQDIDALRTTAGDSDQRIRAKLESVSQTLSQVVARLSRLEGGAVSPQVQATGTYDAAPPSSTGTGPSGADHHPAAEATPAPPTPGAEPSSEAWTTAFHGDDDGASTPVSETEGSEPEAAPPEPTAAEKLAHERRADFIAAARRAVQAATVEAAANVDADETQQGKPGAFSRISQAIRSRKRTLLLAAAIVLAVSAVGTYRSLPTPDGDGDVIAAIPPEEGQETAAGDAGTVAAAMMPAVPHVTESALVAPTFAPDSEVVFAEPVLGTHFQPTTTGSVVAEPAGEEIAEPAPADEELPVDVGISDSESDIEPPRPDSPIGSPKLITAAEDGNPAAMFEVATRYAEGERVSKDLAKAAVWYERAAEGGVAVAQYRIGSLYERGQGVAKDLTKAVNWYQRAADQGNVNAMHNLAVLMSEGVDGAPDRAKALQWFLAAANYGVRDSQYNLGVIYARGLGPEQDLVESYKWFAIAAAEGDSDAAARRDEVGQVLDSDDLAAARATAEAWRVQSALAEANGVSAPDGGWDAPSEVIGKLDREALVRKIQTLLAERGFDPGPADGIPGPKTVRAVKEFQRKVGAPETGQIDSTLIAALSNV